MPWRRSRSATFSPAWWAREDLQDLGLREPTLLHAVLLALVSPEDSHIRWTSFRGAGHASPHIPPEVAGSFPTNTPGWQRPSNATARDLATLEGGAGLEPATSSMSRMRS